eukprot:UN20450
MQFADRIPRFPPQTPKFLVALALGFGNRPQSFVKYPAKRSLWLNPG